MWLKPKSPEDMLCDLETGWSRGDVSPSVVPCVDVLMPITKQNEIVL